VLQRFVRSLVSVTSYRYEIWGLLLFTLLIRFITLLECQESALKIPAPSVHFIFQSVTIVPTESSKVSPPLPCIYLPPAPVCCYSAHRIFLYFPHFYVLHTAVCYYSDPRISERYSYTHLNTIYLNLLIKIITNCRENVTSTSSEIYWRHWSYTGINTYESG